MCEKLNASLDFLRDKYGCPAGMIVAGSEGFELALSNGKKVVLLPWRVERRFVELKKIVDGKTLEDVSTFRFAHFTAGGDPVKLAAKELDLAVFLANSPVRQIFAVRNGDSACNILASLENGMSASVECGTRLPAGTEAMDRHEIIARRGVASDRVVDTQVPQSSIYTWTDSGLRTYTDVDTELFGLTNEQVWVVRAAFAVLMKPALAEEWNHAAAAVRKYATAIVASDADNKPVIF
ncbi:MAG: hypothetical protein GX574_13920 [Lentisphaerae bacterium]|nr:hypothetical protein [Lentisphaerota bacterium]OQC17259.1 MAG: hypothetical protein BWX73_00327 [Lentisphaerae bacterium ADurb.Bin082]HQL86545.1 hypothetical protein [Lentisphaeria bacterium]